MSLIDIAGKCRLLAVILVERQLGDVTTQAMIGVWWGRIFGSLAA
jgi:hypothetical protein